MANEKLGLTDRQNEVFELGNPDTVELIQYAQENDAADRRLTVKEALKKYKKAVFWAMFLSTSLIMEGYDLVIVRCLEVTNHDCLANMLRSHRSTVNRNSRTDLACTIPKPTRNLFPHRGSPGCPIPL